MKDVSTSRKWHITAKLADACERGKKALFSIKLFQLIRRFILFFALLATPYWLLVASDRYVSEAIVIIQKTDQISGPGVDLSAMVSGVGGPNRADQLLLREYLLSVDMLKKLDAALDLRSHYHNRRWDFISRMWFKNAPMEWFHLYWLSRTDVVYDDFSGVLHIRVQAYDPKMAQAIVSMMIHDGEKHMNQIGHEMAQDQVDFLTTQVTLVQDRLLDATNSLVEFQNREGLVAPQATAESFNAIINQLETQKSGVETQLASLPATLESNHPNIVMLKKNLKAIEQQIVEKRALLASTTGRRLNYTVEEFQHLQMKVGFVTDVYKTALAALEKGQMDATRVLKKVSVLQAPTLPAYPLEPKRIYNTVVTILYAAGLAAILKLVENIVLDHVD